MTIFAESTNNHMIMTGKAEYISPEIYELALAGGQDVLVNVSGGDIENPGDGGDKWEW